MKQMMDQIQEFWCTRMHAGVMWPIHGRYQCRTCLREYPVHFEDRADQNSNTIIWYPSRVGTTVRA
jgi:hypothetical protein